MTYSLFSIGGLLTRLNRPQVWFWLAAVCFVVSSSLFWHRSLTVDGPDPVALESESPILPVLDEAHVVTQPRMYPGRYGRRPHPMGATVQPASGERRDSDATDVVHAAWETEDPARQRRVERVSVKSVEVDRPAPVWLSGSIEIVQPSPAAALSLTREQVQRPRPLRLVEQASALSVDSPVNRVTPAAVTMPSAAPQSKAREVRRPAAKPNPANDLPMIIPATPTKRN